MIIAARWPGRYLAALSVSTVLILMAGCTLSGSSGLDDVTPGTDGGGGDTLPTTQAPPTPIPPTTAPTLTELEALGTAAAITATAQAQGAATGGDTTGGTSTTPDPGTAGTTPGAVITSGAGGEIAPPTSTPIGTPVAISPVVCPPTHTVASGENLFRIALGYGTTYQEIAAANGIANPAQISTGQVLNIPSCGNATGTTGGTAGGTATATSHTVQPGENLFRIALLYDLSWTSLAAANGITNPDFLVVGQVLQIPQ